MKNTYINAFNFLISTVNKIIVTNYIFFIYGEESLANVTLFFALNGLSLIVGSIVELEISKNNIKLNYSIGLFILLNILFVTTLFLISDQDSGSIFNSLLIIFWILANGNLLVSGIYFRANQFFRYRSFCILSEVIELSVFLLVITYYNKPLLAVLLSLVCKNATLATLTWIHYIKNKHLGFFDLFELRYPKKSYVRSLKWLTSFSDTFGSIAVASILPYIISEFWGKTTLGNYVFYKQFFSIGLLLQVAVFKGVWRDHISGNLVNKFIDIFKYIGFIVPLAILVIGGLIFRETERFEIFISSGIIITILSYSRSIVYTAGHLTNRVIFNQEITFVFIFSIVTLFNLLSGSLINFLYCTVVSSLLWLIIRISIYALHNSNECKGNESK